MTSLLISQMNAAPDRDAEYDEWYSHVHIRDVMRMRGAIAVQRFVRAERQPVVARPSPYRYLTIYESSDAEVLTAAHREAWAEERLVMTSAMDAADYQVFYYFPVLVEDATPATRTAPQRVVFAQTSGSATASLLTNARALLDGVELERRAAVATYVPEHQLFRRQIPTYPLVAALDASHLSIDRIDAMCQALWSAGAARVTLFDAVTARLTPDNVVRSSEADLAREHEVRERARRAGS